MNLFDQTEVAFAYKTNKELSLSKFVFSLINLKLFVKISTKVTPWLIKSNSTIVHYLVKNSIFKTFVGGESLDAIDQLSWRLSKYGMNITLDYAAEGNGSNKKKEINYGHNEDAFKKTIRYAANNKDIEFVSIKISALASYSLLESLNKAPRLRSGVHSNELEKSEWKELLDRLFRVCILAAQENVKVLIDAEESWIQDPIDRLAIEMMQEFNRENNIIIFNTYQMYRTDRLDFLHLSHKISLERDFKLGVKLVRGAYMEKERAVAASKGVPSPIYPTKENTDRAYEQAIDFCLDNLERISLMVASHNQPSHSHIMEKMRLMNISENHPSIHFSQLFGMSDNISFNLKKLGYNVTKYVPYGSVNESILYLMRRAEENSSIEGQSSRELNLITKEIRRRKTSGEWKK